MLEERMDLKRTSNTIEEIDQILEDLRAYAKVLNGIKENRPNSHVELWITLKSNTKGDQK